MKINEAMSLGPFFERPEAFGLTILTKMSDAGKSQMIVNSASLIHVKNKLLFAYVYSDYESQEDIDWSRHVAKNWTDSILTSNEKINKSSGKLSQLKNMTIERASKNGILVSALAMFLILIVGFHHMVKKIIGRKKD
jgi:hypothetical protein